MNRPHRSILILLMALLCSATLLSSYGMAQSYAAQADCMSQLHELEMPMFDCHDTASHQPGDACDHHPCCFNTLVTLNTALTAYAPLSTSAFLPFTPNLHPDWPSRLERPPIHLS